MKHLTKLWHLECDTVSGRCSGYLLALHGLEKGAPLRPLHSFVITEAKLVTRAYPRFVVVWEEMVIVVDFEEQRVEVTGGGQRGMGTCRAQLLRPYARP
jgi:hypothetical protein